MHSPSLQLHYYLRDGGHSMNAHVRNKCEAEALAAFQHILGQLGLQVEIETLAYEEGGLREIWKFVTKPENAYGNLMLLLALIIPNFITAWKTPTPDKEKEAIEKEISKATLEERRLSVEKLRREIQQMQQAQQPATPPAAAARAPGQAARAASSPAPAVSEATVRSAMEALAYDTKVITRRSNYYKTLLPYGKVTNIGMSYLRDHTLRIEGDDVLVNRESFIDFVLKTNKLPSEIVDEAIIEIVAPVIKAGNMQWKGVHKDKPIGFTMRDKAYKDMVLRREVSFLSGDAIRCQLGIERELNEIGEAVITGYSVNVVLEKIDSTGVSVTPQGRRHRFDDRNKNAQASLDLVDRPDGGRPA